VALGDVNGDGKLDLVLANDATGLASMLLGKGDGSFAANVDYPTGAGPHWIALADVSGDGELDIVTANQSGSSVSVLLGKGGGTFVAGVDYPGQPPSQRPGEDRGTWRRHAARRQGALTS
jgi:hypothetical protein